jgi:O-antigen/teichoic acid export membrane protein
MSSLISKLSNKFHLDLAFLFKNGIWTVLRQVVVLTTSLFLSVAMARLLSQELFGKYQLFLSILSIVAVFSLPGLNTSVTRSVARGYEGSYQKSVRRSLVWSLLGMPILVIVGIYYYKTGDLALGWSLMASAVLFPLMYAHNTWDSFLQAKERFDVAMKYSSIQSVISVLLMLVVVFLSPENLLVIIITYLVLNTYFNIQWYLSSKKYISNSKVDGETIPYGKFLTKIGVIGIIASQIDKIIVGFFIGPAELAIYSIGLSLSRRIYDFLKSFLSIYTPRISKFNTLNYSKYLQIFVIFSLVGLLSYLLMPLVIRILYTTKYDAAILVGQLSIIFLPFFALNSFYKNHILFYLKNEKVLRQESVIFPVVKMLLMIPLAAFWGIYGLAFIAGFQYLIDQSLLYWLSKRQPV